MPFPCKAEKINLCIHKPFSCSWRLNWNAFNETICLVLLQQWTPTWGPGFPPLTGTPKISLGFFCTFTRQWHTWNIKNNRKYLTASNSAIIHRLCFLWDNTKLHFKGKCTNNFAQTRHLAGVVLIKMAFPKDTVTIIRPTSRCSWIKYHVSNRNYKTVKRGAPTTTFSADETVQCFRQSFPITLWEELSPLQYADIVFLCYLIPRNPLTPFSVALQAWTISAHL